MTDLTQEQITKLQEEFKALQATLKAAGALPKAERKRERCTEYFDIQSALLLTVDAQTNNIDKVFDLSKKADDKGIGATWITFKPEDCKYGFAVISKSAEEAKRAARETKKAADEKAAETAAKVIPDVKAETTDFDTTEEATDTEQENDEMSTEV